MAWSGRPSSTKGTTAAAKGAGPRHKPGGTRLVVGAGLLLVGAVLLLVGLSAWGSLMGLMFGALGGGLDSGAGSDLDQQVKSALAKAMGTAALVEDVAGLVLLVAGFAVVKRALRPPKPKSIEELVREEVDRRMGAAAIIAPAASAVPTRAPTVDAGTHVASALGPPTGGAVEAPAHVARVGDRVAPVAPPSAGEGAAHCPQCGSVLVAGRYCRHGHV